MGKYRVKSWSDFQHYKDRRPAWIKLHRSILDDYDFQSMPDASRALAPCIWLLASEYDEGEIPADHKMLAFRFRRTEKEIDEAIKPLIDRGFLHLEQDASKPLAECKQNATPEKRREEREKEKKSDEEVFAYWQSVMAHPKAKLDDKRRRKIRDRLKDGYSVEDLKAAIDGCKASPFHQGKNDTGTVHDDIELICRDGPHVEQFMKVLESRPHGALGPLVE